MSEQKAVRQVESGRGDALASGRRRPPIAVLAGAGIVGAVGYSLVALVHSLVRDDHGLVADPIAKLASGATGWVQSFNFIASGC